MRRFSLALTVSTALALSTPAPATAGSTTERFGDCLVMNTTGRDRIALMRWIVFSYATHPSVSDIITLPPEVLDEADRMLADLFVDLVVDRCLPEARAAIEEIGPQAFEIAFRALGEIAAVETMNDRGVQHRMQAFAEYLDEDRLEKAFE